MRLINASFEIISHPNWGTLLKQIERIGRICYQSEWLTTETSCFGFINKLIDRQHVTPLEHFSFTVKFICDRGVSHELVRHRLCAFTQESTRYCNYSNSRFGESLTFIIPCWFTADETTAALQGIFPQNANPRYITG